jgi:hypothetical protein
VCLDDAGVLELHIRSLPVARRRTSSSTALSTKRAPKVVSALYQIDIIPEKSCRCTPYAAHAYHPRLALNPRIKPTAQPAPGAFCPHRRALKKGCAEWAAPVHWSLKGSNRYMSAGLHSGSAIAFRERPRGHQALTPFPSWPRSALPLFKHCRWATIEKGLR